MKSHRLTQINTDKAAFAHFKSVFICVHLWPILFLLCALCASARAQTNRVQFFLYNGLQQPAAGEEITLKPIAVQFATNGLQTLDTVTNDLDDNGQATFTNMVPGAWAITVGSITHFTITVPVGTFAYVTNATNLLTGVTAPGATSVYTAYQADHRYYINALTNGEALAVSNSEWPTLTELAFYSTNIAIPFSGSLMPTNSQTNVITITNAIDTAGDWEVTVTPGLAAIASTSNCLWTAWAGPATNNITVMMSNAGWNTNTVNTSATYRLTWRQIIP
jgi:hypothetical protein